MNIELALLEKRGIDEALWSAIGSSIFPGANEESKLMAFDYCKARGLDILKKPCHIVPMSVKDAKTGKYSWRDVIMPGIAEQRITANRTGEYAGQDPPVYGPMVDIEIGSKTHHVPESCTVTVYRMIQGERVPCSHTEYFEEACGTTKDGNLNAMWTKRKRAQLAKCAEAGALRKAFPEELGGIITADEEVNEMRDATPPTKRITTRAKAEPISGQTGVTVKELTPRHQEQPAPEDASQAIPVQSESETPLRRAYVVEVEKTGGQQESGQKWTRYRVTLSYGDTTEVATTFSTHLGDLAISQQERWVMVHTQQEPKGLKLVDLQMIQEEGGIA